MSQSPLDEARAPTMHGDLLPRLAPHLARTRTTLQWPSAGRAPEVHAESETSSPDLFAVGDRVADSYVIRSVLGSGGMGQVYEAQDLALNRVVAIKAAWPHVGPEPLRREAQVLAAFRHGGLVTAHALVKHGDRELLVMERITGAPLSELLGRRALLPLSETLDLLSEICDTLAVLHASGLAHCDLKPANIMLAAAGRVVLLDFGIVRVEQLRGEQRFVSGSPHYMAPETIRGQVRPGESHLVDIYALGVIAFVLCTGRAPFDHADPRQLILQHLERDPPRLRDVMPEAPAAMDALCHSMMSKLPEERPDRIEVVRDALRVLQRLSAPAR